MLQVVDDIFDGSKWEGRGEGEGEVEEGKRTMEKRARRTKEEEKGGDNTGKSERREEKRGRSPRMKEVVWED